MTNISKRSSIHRRRLLAGAGIALAATLAAQHRHPPRSPPSRHTAITSSLTSRPHPWERLRRAGTAIRDIIVAGSITGATLASSDNLKTARAASNQADLSLAPDPGIDDTPYGGTALTVSTDGVSAKGGTVIASRRGYGDCHRPGDDGRHLVRP